MKFVFLFSILAILGIGFSVTATISGYVVNSTFSPVNAATIELWNMSMSGPPSSTAQLSNTSGTDGNFTITADFNSSINYQLKAYLDNGVTVLIGPTTPIMPYTMFVSSVNGTNITLKAGVLVYVNATNRTGQLTNISGGVFYTKYDFPLFSQFDSGSSNFTFYVQKGYNYSITAYQPPTGGQMGFFYGEGRMLKFNITDTSLALVSYLNLTLNFNTSNNWSNSVVSGNLSIFGGNPPGINFTNISLYTYDQDGMGAMLTFQPFDPFDNICNMTETGPTMCGNLNITNGTFNFTEVTAQNGINYLLAAYANNGTHYFIGYQNMSLVNNNNYSFNITLRPAAGAVTSPINSSWDISFAKVNISQKNSSGDSVSSSNAGGVKVVFDFNNSGTIIPIRLSLFSQGNVSASSSYFAIPNNTWVTGTIYGSQSAPRKFKFNTSVNTTYIVTMKAQDFSDENGASITSLIDDIKFYKSDSTCVPPELPASCLLMNLNMNGGDNMDPIKLIYMGTTPTVKILLTNGVTIMFKDVDMISSGPPGMQAQQTANDYDSGSSYDRRRYFGSFAPDVYSRAYVGMPYSAESTVNDEGLSESGNISILLRSLVDYDGSEVWNTSMNISQVPSYWSDYNTSWFNTSTSGMPCNSTNTSADCYVNLTANMVWMSVPHFSASTTSLIGTSVARLSSSSVISSTSSSKTVPILSKTFNCEDGKLEVSAVYSGSGISGLNIKLFSTVDFSYVSKVTDSNGKAVFEIKKNGKYEVDSDSSGSYLTSVLSPFYLEVCPKQTTSSTESGTQSEIQPLTVQPEANESVPGSPTATEAPVPPTTLAVEKNNALSALSSADSEISIATKSGKDVSDAKKKLNDANEAISAGKYEEAQALALEAFNLAKNAKAKAVTPTAPSASTTPTSAAQPQKGFDTGTLLLVVVVIAVVLAGIYLLTKGKGASKGYKGQKRF